MTSITSLPANHAAGPDVASGAADVAALAETLRGLTGAAPPAELLVQAVTHGSHAHERGGASYQRLEFLGDAVLNLCAAKQLVHAFPDADEGTLTPLRQRLVRNDVLGEVASAAGLQRYVRVGRSELGKGRIEPKILADVAEAVIGALFLSEGLGPCEALVVAWLGPKIPALARLVAEDGPTNAINRLQEHVQQVGWPAPTYHFEETPTGFRARLELPDGRPFEGEGPKKADARRRAAALALAALERDPLAAAEATSADDNPVGRLNERLQAGDAPAYTYEDYEALDDGQWRSVIRLATGERYAGIGRKKQAAKAAAARALLAALDSQAGSRRGR